MSRSVVATTVALVVGLIGFFIEELVEGAVWSALAPEFTRSLDIITGGYGGLIVTIIEIVFFVALVLALWGLVSKYRH